MEEANKLIGAGKKYLVTGKVPEAVSVLQEACGLLAKQYGDTADECGEALFWCGKSLLDLARMENSVLGNALEGVPEEEEDEEDKPKDSNVESTENVDEKTRDELRVQVYDAMAEKENKDAEKVDGKQSEDAEESKTESSEAAVEGDEEKDDEDDGKKSEAEEEKENKETEEEPPANEEESANKEAAAAADKEQEDDGEEQSEREDTAEKDSEDEEVGNLQLAWEMLEVAKVIYKRKTSKEDQLMAAQAHLKLGEVSAESGNYTQALEDYQECLKLQLKHLDPDSRLLAETHYQLGVTYSLNLQYSEAIEALNRSISVIKSRLEKLQELLDKAEDPEAMPDERKELEELKILLPEIQEKVQDATEGAKLVNSAAEAVKDVLDGNPSPLPDSTVNSDSSCSAQIKSSTAPVPVSDISHLVRKKRKPEESPVKEAGVKRVKQDDVQEPHSNGVHRANGDSNGHANDMEVAT